MTDATASAGNDSTRATTHACPYVYGIYGICLHSEIPLPLPAYTDGELAHIELRIAPASYFADAIRDVPMQHAPWSWYEFCHLPDKSSYARWSDVGEFLASGDGSRIICRQFNATTTESFQVYLLGQALSFAL